MTQLKDVKDYAVRKSLEAALTVLEAGDNTEELRDLHAEATRYRTVDSFTRESNVLHVDAGEYSALSEFIDEVETPAPSQKLNNNNYSKEWEAEGIAEGLYTIFNESNADRVMIHSDDERYFGPSMSGIASMEVVRKMEEDRNIDWQTRQEAEDYLWEEAFDERDQELWSNWLDQRPRAEQ